MTTINASAAAEAAETEWVDAWVRWERNSMGTYNDEEEQEDEGSSSAQLPPPTESYSFPYPNPSSSSNANANDIIIELKGFHSDSEQIWNSTGLTLWRSSQHLCDYLVEHSQELQHKRILEIGSGLGRCGILAHKLAQATEDADNVGNKSAIYLTDGDTDTLMQLRANIEHNTGVNYGSDSKNSEIVCHQLLWGKETAQKFLSRHACDETFDIILGSDLIYVESVIEPLFETVQILLRCHPGGMFVMAHCSRRQGNEVQIDMVLDAAERAGFEHEQVVQDDDISLFIFRWKGKAMT